MEEAVKVFVAGREIVAIRCPRCRQLKEVAVTRLEKHQIKVRCACSHVFPLQVEFRKRHRKKTGLAGSFRHLTKEELAKLNWEFRAVDLRRENCRITNLSLDGLGFTATGHGLAEGEVVEMVFTLDDSAKTELVKRAIVRAVRGDYIGCEFLEEEKGDRRIGFYTLA